VLLLGGVGPEDPGGAVAEDLEAVVVGGAGGEGIDAKAGGGVVDFYEGDGGGGGVADVDGDVVGVAAGEGGEGEESERCWVEPHGVRVAVVGERRVRGSVRWVREKLSCFDSWQRNGRPLDSVVAHSNVLTSITLTTATETRATERCIVQRNLPSVFIVDDEQVIAGTLTTILQRNGFTATGFTDPLEALVAARHEAPDLVLSDVMMPGLSGVELAMAIRRDCPGSKIMLFSGHAQMLDLLSAAREKGYDFNILAKPLHPADLLRHIRLQHPEWALQAACD
jgi:CheY-like chemotaxis protein